MSPLKKSSLSIWLMVEALLLVGAASKLYKATNFSFHSDFLSWPPSVTPTELKFFPQTKLHFLSSLSSTSIEAFSRNFADGNVYLINLHGEKDIFSSNALSAIGSSSSTPLALIQGLHPIPWCGIKFNTTFTKYIFKISILILLSKSYEMNHSSNSRSTFMCSLGSKNAPETHFREIFYIFLEGNRDFFATKFQASSPQTILENEDTIPSTTYLLGLSQTGRITELWYLCKSCDFNQYHLFQMGSFEAKLFRAESFTVHQDGLNFVWKIALHEITYESARPIVSREFTLRDIAKKSREKDYVSNALLRLAFTSTPTGTQPRWLNVSRLPDEAESLPQVIIKLNTFPDLVFNHVMLDMSSYNFITCNGYREGIDFAAYINPFDAWVWMAIGFVVVVGPLMGASALVHSGSKRNAKMLAHRLIEAIAFSLMSQYYPRANCGFRAELKDRNSLRYQFVFRSSWGLFMINCIVLVNCYISLGISNLTAPKPKHFRWKHVYEMENSSMFINVSRNDLPTEILRNISEFDDKKYFVDLYSDLAVDITHAVMHCANMDPKLGIKDQRILNVDSHCQKMQNVLSQLVSTKIDLNTIGKLISANGCSHLRFYITLDSRIEEELVDLQRDFPLAPFYIGKEFHFHRIGWKISKNGRGLSRIVNTLVSSGIYGMIRNLSGTSNRINLERLKLNLKLGDFNSLNSNLIVVFYMNNACIAVSLLIFCVEHFWNRLQLVPH